MDMKRLSRRDFLRAGGAVAAGAGASLLLSRLAFLQPIETIDNPLEYYPTRDWEKVYRDLYRFDRQFTFLCAPNDTHNCLLRASVRKGVATRVEASYGYGDTVDLHGNRASHRWEPRACNKGLSILRKVYGDRRIKGAFVRKGFLDWSRAGFPRDPETGRGPAEYFNRGKDDWVKLPWPEAFELAARAMTDIARAYSGPQGQERLRRQGYDEAMVAQTEGAGTRTLKFRGGMPFLGATRIFGLYRFANMLALLDDRLRGVGRDQAKGATGWDNYSWHTDLPPGHPMVTGQQTVDFDLFTAENAKLITLWGMNWISTKMPDSHWLTEARLKGARVVVIACEYQSTANKADEVIIIRPGTDAALALGLAHVLVRDRLFDEEYVKSFTDLPLLVRMDTLKLLRASDVVPGYRQAALSNYIRVARAGDRPASPPEQNDQYVPEALRQEWGDFTVWDAGAREARVVTRDQVGRHFLEAGVSPALEGAFRVRTVDGKDVEVRPVFDLVKEYLKDYDPQTVSQITWAPGAAIEDLARSIAALVAGFSLARGPIAAALAMWDFGFTSFLPPYAYVLGVWFYVYSLAALYRSPAPAKPPLASP